MQAWISRVSLDYDFNFVSADGRLDQLLPNGFAEKMRASQWEEIITVQYKTFLGMDPLQCRHG